MPLLLRPELLAAVPADYRDPLYAPRALAIERRENGEWLIVNEVPIRPAFADALAPLRHWAALRPDGMWIAERSGMKGDQPGEWTRVSFSEGLARVETAARALAGGGAGPRALPGEGPGLGVGDRLLILARNGIEHAIFTYAAMGIGAIVAPVSPQYGAPGADPARLAGALALLGPKLALVDDCDAQAAACATIRAAGAGIIALRNARDGAEDAARLTARFATGADVTSGQPGERTAKILLTSGSTGIPKGVAINHRGLAVNSAQIESCFVDPDPPILVNSAPWSHSLGANAVLHSVLHRGGALYIDQGQPVPGRFDETLANLREIAPSTHIMVPAGWAMLADALEVDADLARTFFSRLKLMQYGGAALGQAVADRIAAVATRVAGKKISFAAGYGATETGPTACNVHWINERMGQIGLPVPGTAIKLVPAGEKYEARLKGPQLFSGYFGRTDLTAAAFDEEGFYRLGDSVTFAKPGAPEAGLVFAGRLSEDFKLANGSFVSAGALRVAIVSAIGGAVADAVICGEGENFPAALLFLSPGFCRTLAPGIGDLAMLAEEPAVIEAIKAGIAAHNRNNPAATARIGRIAILPEGPDLASGEITDKGYLNQRLCRERRLDLIAFMSSMSEDAVFLLHSGGAHPRSARILLLEAG